MFAATPSPFVGEREDPGLDLVDLMANESLVVECIGQRRNTLAARQQMHGQRVGIIGAAHGVKLLSEPSPELAENHSGIALRGVLQLGQLRTQGAHRAPEALDVLAIDDEHLRKALQALGRRCALVGPSLKHRPGFGGAMRDHRRKDVVLRLEVVIEIAARNLQLIRDVGKRGVLEAALIEQAVGFLDDQLPGAGLK